MKRLLVAAVFASVATPAGVIFASMILGTSIGGGLLPTWTLVFCLVLWYGQNAAEHERAGLHEQEAVRLDRPVRRQEEAPCD